MSSPAPRPAQEARSNALPVTPRGSQLIYRPGAGAVIRHAMHQELLEGQGASSSSSTSTELAKREIRDLKLIDLPVLRQEMAQLAQNWKPEDDSPQERQAAQKWKERQLETTQDLIKRLETLHTETLEDFKHNPATCKQTFSGKMADLNDHIFDLGEENVIHNGIYELAMKDCAVQTLHFKDRHFNRTFDYEANHMTHQPSRVAVQSSAIGQAPASFDDLIREVNRMVPPPSMVQASADAVAGMASIAAMFDAERDAQPISGRAPRNYIDRMIHRARMQSLDLVGAPDDGRIGLADLEQALAIERQRSNGSGPQDNG